MNPGEVKFLIIRFSSIGDIVLTSPVIRCLKEQVENSTLHYFTKPQFSGLLQENPYIDKIHTLKKSFVETVDELKNEGFDYVIDLHKNFRTYRYKNSLKVMDFSFPKLNWEKWLYVNLKINKLPDKHIVDRYFHAVRVFDVNNDGKGLDFFISDNDNVNIESIDSGLKKGFIVFGIGGNHFTKKMPAEKIVNLCKKIDFPIVLTGGEEDNKTGEYIEQNCNNVYNACGKFSIMQSASIVKQSKLVISHDTGIMHIAAAFKKIIISLWGNTVPEFGMYPYLPGEGSRIFQVDELSCRPCTKIGFSECPKKHFKCMEMLQEIDIANHTNKILKNP